MSLEIAYPLYPVEIDELAEKIYGKYKHFDSEKHLVQTARRPVGHS